MGILTRLASGYRALPGPGAGIGNTIKNPAGKGRVRATSATASYMTPGQPMYREWNAQQAIQIAYLGHEWVYRCLRVKAETIAGLPFRAGPDPDDPSTTTPDAPLARLLGPASPQAPGGPNPTTTARGLWCWSKVQYDVTGVMAWNLITEAPGSDVIEWVYPLVSAQLDAVPSTPGSPDWFSSYVYHTPTGDLPFKKDEVFYAWRASAKDWRQPESPLQAARLPIQIATACDNYMWSLLKNGMVASHIVLAPPFDDDDQRRAWEDQFFSEFSGFDNAGKTIFAEAENEYDESGKLFDQAKIQVIPLAMKSVDAQLLEMIREAKIDITIATGVPESLIGNASQKTFANAEAEYKNFWTITLISDITELEDNVNINLAPRLGKDVGWFDLSRVVALQPPTIFQPPSVLDAINAGIVSVPDATALLGIPNAGKPARQIAESVETAPIGEESSLIGAGTSGNQSGGARSLHIIGNDALSQMTELPDGWGWRHRPMTTHTYRAGNAGWGIVRVPRPRIRLANLSSGVRALPAPPPALAMEALSTVAEIRARREGMRTDAEFLDQLGDQLSELLPV